MTKRYKAKNNKETRCTREKKKKKEVHNSMSKKKLIIQCQTTAHIKRQKKKKKKKNNHVPASIASIHLATTTRCLSIASSLLIGVTCKST